MEKHKIRPLKSVPEETIQAMRTEIFLNANFDMRKNLLTGVAEYREKFSNDQTFKPLTEEVRNDMTLRAIEMGLKAWDKNVNRFIDSTRIEQYDPVNTWLDKLPEWDGHDYIADLAARVPTDQPHWPGYLRMWLTGMVAKWRESDKQLTGNALVPLLIATINTCWHVHDSARVARQRKLTAMGVALHNVAWMVVLLVDFIAYY